MAEPLSRDQNEGGIIPQKEEGRKKKKTVCQPSQPTPANTKTRTAKTPKNDTGISLRLFSEALEKETNGSNAGPALLGTDSLPFCSELWLVPQPIKLWKLVERVPWCDISRYAP